MELHVFDSHFNSKQNIESLNPGILFITMLSYLRTYSIHLTSTIFK